MKKGIIKEKGERGGKEKRVKKNKNLTPRRVPRSNNRSIPLRRSWCPISTPTPPIIIIVIIIIIPRSL